MTPDIYTYTDYRKYLKDWFEARAGRPSIRGFAKKIDCSPAQLSSVIAGTRDLAGPLAETIAVALGLDAAQQAYFLLLVAFEQSDTRARRRELLDQIMAIRRFHHSSRIEDSMYLFFSRWYYPAVLELARCRNFRSDPDWIAETLVPSVPREEIVEALEVLERWNFLVRDAEGGLIPGEPSYATDPQVGVVMGPALTSLHRWILARGREAVEEFPKEERHFGTMAFAVPEASLPELKQFVNRFEADAIGRFAEQPNPSRIFQLSVQLFPLSKPTGS